MKFEQKNLTQINPDDVIAFENRIDRDLPADYKSFLLLNNGGRTDLCVLTVEKFGTVIVNDFFGLEDGSSLDLDDNLETFRGRIPDGFLPFANDPGGNLFLLTLNGTAPGGVFFWDHENEPHTAPLHWNEFKNVYKIADSFQDFVQQLKPDN
ncbi:SMI1/KNR4 family protein [Massilia aquatica]|uniref:SMI1/KNR4 family protein n=1 Tax=Massilia aquatica TaxID=2609000 RepID=A0ABX0LVT3_9BURK|nr:SMI1/KNR4 family protein [Massilia aquatica]NHZ38652.1 SMI1/KNR4 family protein [Massilia aquatica]